VAGELVAGLGHDTPQGNYLVMNLDSEIKFQNFIMESVASDVNDRPIQNLEYIRAFYTQEEIQKPYPRFPHLTPTKYPTLFDLPYKH
jgi:hypothetical protein